MDKKQYAEMLEQDERNIDYPYAYGVLHSILTSEHPRNPVQKLAEAKAFMEAFQEALAKARYRYPLI